MCSRCLPPSCDELAAGRYVIASVADQGPGMAPETLERAFEPFSTTKPQGCGTGLGLSMVYGAMQNHGGTITLSSDLGAGTTATFYLPALDSAPAERPAVLAAEPSEQELAATGTATVLLVDDEELVRRAAGRILRKMGLTVIEAKDGSDALRQFEAAAAVDLVVLDVAMPVMDGVECFRRLRELAPDISVVVASGFAEGEATEGLLRDGAKAFIQKPFDMKVFQKMVLEALSP